MQNMTIMPERAMSQPKVVFVVLNWNQKDLTLACLASLQAQDYTNFVVVLVDNGSIDGSVAAIRAQYSDVTLIANETNLGLAVANNQGIRCALDMGSDYVVLLNNDTIVAPDMLTQLVAVAEKDATVGFAGPTMFYYDQPQTIWCTAGRVDWSNGGSFLVRNNMNISILDGLAIEEVEFIPACAVLIRTSVFEAIGLIDERFFIYFDETDFTQRASRAGWRSVYVPQATMWHKVSATMGSVSPTTDYYMSRNRFLFLAKHLTGLRKARALAAAGTVTLTHVAAFTIKNHGGRRLPHRNAKLLAVRDALLGRWGPMGTDVAAACHPSRR